MQHTDKNVPRKWFFGGVLWYCALQDRWSFCGLLPPGHPPGLYPGPTRGLTAPPDPQLLQAMTHSHCISCLQQDTTFIYALMTNLAHHSKFLKKRPGGGVGEILKIVNTNISYCCKLCSNPVNDRHFLLGKGTV